MTKPQYPAWIAGFTDELERVLARHGIDIRKPPRANIERGYYNLVCRIPDPADLDLPPVAPRHGAVIRTDTGTDRDGRSCKYVTDLRRLEGCWALVKWDLEDIESVAGAQLTITVERVNPSGKTFERALAEALNTWDLQKIERAACGPIHRLPEPVGAQVRRLLAADLAAQLQHTLEVNGAPMDDARLAMVADVAKAAITDITNTPSPAAK